MAEAKKKKQKPYIQRAMNTFGAKITGRGASVKEDVMGEKYLTEKELEAYKAKKKTK